MVSEFAGMDVLVILPQLGALDDLCTAFTIFFLQRTIAVAYSPPGLTGLLPGATDLRGTQRRLTTINFNNLVLLVVNPVVLGSIPGAIGLSGSSSKGGLTLKLRRC